MSKGPAPVSVPNVVGLAPGAAATAISGAGLSPLRGADEYSASVAAGLVSRQDPAAASQVLPGSTVNYFVSKGPAPVSVPNVVGLAPGAAATAISGAGLSPLRGADEYSASVAAGLVSRQDPAAASQVLPGSTVNYFVSKGPAPVSVPNVVGLAPGAAATAISGAGLSPLRGADEYSASVAAGLVSRQDPAAASQVLPGSTVNYFVSKGPAPVSVPNVVGLAPGAAATAISGAGLSPLRGADEYSASVAAGLVSRQDPAAASQVLPGSTVNYFVSKGPAPVSVPNVVGLAPGAAATAISGAGLSPLRGADEYSASVAAGLVSRQDPAAASQVLPGSTVNYFVSKGPAPVSVPNVVGLAPGAAATAISGAGLSPLRGADEYSASVAAGLVSRQDPAAASQVLPGSTVNYFVSKGPAPVSVPNVVGLAPGAAATAISGAGLSPLRGADEYSASVAAGLVSRQVPPRPARSCRARPSTTS